MSFPDGASGKEPICQWRKCKSCGFSPWVGKIPWRRARQPTSCLDNPMHRAALWATVHRVTQSWTQLKQLGMHRLAILWLIHVAAWQKTVQHCKAIVLQLKIIIIQKEAELWSGGGEQRMILQVICCCVINHSRTE